MSTAKLDGEVVVHFTDFTKVKYLHFQLEKKIKELERSNDQLEEFAHAASHDLKEPIRKVQVFTNILKTQLTWQLQESEIKTFEKIENATKRMWLLVDDLLQYSQLTQEPHQKETIDLNEIIEQVKEDLELDIEQKTATIQTRNLPVIQGFKRQVQQMFQNLISNALKYSKADTPPQIEIKAQAVMYNEQNYYLLEVRDNGIGFEQQFDEKIFQMFTRLHGKNEYSGTGGGLSIVKKVVANHKGFITAEGFPGQGSSFKVYLPVS